MHLNWQAVPFSVKLELKVRICEVRKKINKENEKINNNLVYLRVLISRKDYEL